MAVSIQITKFKLPQYQWRAISPNLMMAKVTRYKVYSITTIIIIYSHTFKNVGDQTVVIPIALYMHACMHTMPYTHIHAFIEHISTLIHTNITINTESWGQLQ